MKLTKKIIITAILALLSTSNIALSMPIQNIENQKNMNENSATQALEFNKNIENEIFNKYNELSTRYINNIEHCEPLHFNQYLDLFGLKISFKFDINGWVNNKCNYFVTGNISGLGNDIREVFNLHLKDDVLAKFEPKIECNFSQTDLSLITTIIRERSKENQELISKILNAPNEEVKINNLEKRPNANEEKLIKTLTSGKACTIVNKDELMQQFTSVMEEL